MEVLAERRDQDDDHETGEMMMRRSVIQKSDWCTRDHDEAEVCTLEVSHQELVLRWSWGACSQARRSSCSQCLKSLRGSLMMMKKVMLKS